MDNHIKMGTPRPPTPAEVAWGEEVAKGLGESAVAEDNVVEYRYHQACEVIRQDERRKAEQEIADYLRHINLHNAAYGIRCGEYKHFSAPQSPVAPDSSPGLSEARGEVGGKGDRPADQAPAKENEDLRPCPFCGSAESLDGQEEETVGWVGCGCGSVAGPSGWKKSGRALWNTRPIEDRLRTELFEAQEGCRALEQAHAEAMALVLAHEGRIENQVRIIDQLLDERKALQEAIADQATYNKHLSALVQTHYRAKLSLQQQLAEEKQYNDVLEKRLREEEGKFCAEKEANGMHYEGGRQEAVAQILRWIKGDPNAPSWVLANVIKEGRPRQEAVSYNLAFDRAQLRAETEVATAGRIADWLKGRYNVQIVPEMIREGAWREGAVDALGGLSEPEAGGGLSEVAPDNDPEEEEEVFTEELGRVAAESDPGDWRWARHQVCALIRWSLGLRGPEACQIRGELNLLLSAIEACTG
jgi:hypothetical protein